MIISRGRHIINFDHVRQVVCLFPQSSQTPEIRFYFDSGENTSWDFDTIQERDEAFLRLQDAIENSWKNCDL